MKRFLHKPILLKLLRNGDDFIFVGEDKKEWRVVEICEHFTKVTDGRVIDRMENTRMVRKLKGY